MIKSIILFVICLIGFPILLWLHNKEEKRCYRTPMDYGVRDGSVPTDTQ